eukprot:scaffold66811_cov30-Tisochrysis_lutea.AAC.1
MEMEREVRAHASHRVVRASAYHLRWSTIAYSCACLCGLLVCPSICWCWCWCWLYARAHAAYYADMT